MADPRSRPIPYPVGSEKRRDELRRLREIFFFQPSMAIQFIQICNRLAKMFPTHGERCEARTRTGAPCQAQALNNGRCKNHGGASTGPATAEGKARSLKNLQQFNK